jgi:predicted CopG family antitoxin
MATKTISIDLEAYDRLRRARRTPNESFSRVIKRATWPTPPRTSGSFLRALESVGTLDVSEIDRLEAAQRADGPPEDPWRDG